MVRRLVGVSFLLLAACEIEVVDGVGSHGSSRARPEVPRLPAEPAEPGEGGETEYTRVPGAGDACSLPIVRDKELVITQQSVLLDRRPAWSFRARMTELAGSEAAAASFTYAWVDQWRTVTEVGPARAPVTPRPDAAKVLGDPFALRLLAIVNRPDLRAEDDGCAGAGGELRFVYGASFAFTIIVEIPWPATRTPRAWTEAWHALGEQKFGDGYNAALEALTDAIVGASPPATWKVRTNERAFGATWEMRDFALAGGALVQVPIATTPRIELNGSASLDAWAKDNRASIADRSFALPSAFQAGAAPVPNASFRWTSRTLSETERARLSGETCNGCHGGEHSGGSLSFQHIAPANAPSYYDGNTSGETQLSRWLRDEELPRRERSVRAALCAPACTTAPPPGGNDGSDDGYREP
ncbi:MAG: hypothetical protein KIT84_40320 [Labilithrix sp.]|nr:hypothetical protein [Labilithrix sp.]MCW5817313.1 hypothetical protein [Labilithrix sp.]